MAKKKAEVKASMERVYNIPIGKVYKFPRTKRAMKAEKFLRSYIARHYKADESNVKLSSMVHSYIWMHGMKKPPRKIKIKAKKMDDKVYVFTIDETDDINKFKIKKASEEKKEVKSKEKKGDKEKMKKGEVKEEEPKEKEVKEKEPEEEKNTKKTKGEKLLESHKEVFKK